MTMPIEQIIKKNEGKIAIVRNFIIPILIAACFWILDSRYLSKSDWQISRTQQNELIVSIGGEQKAAFNKLTEAITALTNEQRTTAELQRNSWTAVTQVISSMEKRDARDDVRWAKENEKIEKIISRLDLLSISSAKHDSKIENLETVTVKNETNINRTTDLLLGHINGSTQSVQTGKKM